MCSNIKLDKWWMHVFKYVVFDKLGCMKSVAYALRIWMQPLHAYMTFYLSAMHYSHMSWISCWQWRLWFHPTTYIHHPNQTIYIIICLPCLKLLLRTCWTLSKTPNCQVMTLLNLLCQLFITLVLMYSSKLKTNFDLYSLCWLLKDFVILLVTWSFFNCMFKTCLN